MMNVFSHRKSDPAQRYSVATAWRLRGMVLALCVLCLAASAGPEPLALPQPKLLGGAALLADGGPGGEPCWTFDGKPASMAVFPTNALPLGRLTGDAVSVSLWYRMDERVEGARLGLGFDTPPTIRIPGRPQRGEETPVIRRVGCDVPVVTGQWHHVAYVFAASNRVFANYTDGKLQHRGGMSSPMENPLIPLGKSFKGRIANVRVWDCAVPEDVLLIHTPTTREVDDLTAAFGRFKNGAGHTGFQMWCEDRIAELTRIRKAGVTGVPAWIKLQTAARNGDRLSAWATASAATPGLAGAPVGLIDIHPYDNEMRLPNLLPYDGRGLARLAIPAARDEFESRTFQAFPYRDIARFSIRPTALTCGAASMPAEILDVKVVKVWHIPGGGWNAYMDWGGRGFPMLAPELLLHDDALIRVDEPARRNSIRLSEPEGPRYVDISTRSPPPMAFDPDREAIFDAATFQPLDLKQGVLQQFWITAHPPSNAVPGLYKGALTLLEGEKSIGELPVELTVYPFVLPRPRTNYDIDCYFITSFMGGPSLEGIQSSCKDPDQAERKLYAVLRNAVEHNVLHLPGPDLGSEDPESPGIRQLQIMLKAGMPCDVVFSGAANGGEWIFALFDGPPAPVTPERYPELFERCLKKDEQAKETMMRVMDRYLGHRNVFCTGWDEPDIWTLRYMYPFFANAKRYGAKAWTTSGTYPHCAPFVDIDDHSVSSDYRARQWHGSGAMSMCYATPFPCPENPDIWRRHGLRLYYSNNDGHLNNSYSLPWNEFAGKSDYRPFGMMYLTQDGVVDTVPWEGLRESFDDVRYATLLRLLAREAMASRDPVRALLGRRAEIWAATLNPEYSDAEDFRREIVDWILRLWEFRTDGERTVAFR